MIVALIFSILVNLSLALLPTTLGSQRSCEIVSVTTPIGFKPISPPLQEDIHLIIEFGDTFLVFHQNVPQLILEDSVTEKLTSVLRVDDQSCDQIIQNLYLRSRVHKRELDQYSNGTVTIWHHYGILLLIKSNTIDLDGFSSLVDNFDISQRIVSLATTSRGYIPNDVKKYSHLAAIPDNISKERWFAHVSKLASYNRYTRAQGIVSAEAWLRQELANYGTKITVQQLPWTSGSWSGRNTIATLPGRTNSLVVVGAHFDSTSQSPTTAAPGAEDDGSGSAALLEFLKVLVDSGIQFEKTIVLVWFGGEEQGLLGSRAYATSLVNSGANVYFALCMDMIGYSSTNNYFSVILETQRRYETYLIPLRNAAAQYSANMQVVISYNPFGSDHMSFLDRNIPSALAIDTDWDSYPHYHRTTDTADKLVPEMALLIMRMNIAAIVEMASK